MKKFKDFLNENKLLKNIFGNLGSKISILEVKPSNNIESNQENIFSEILDRQARSCNLIFFNAPEILSHTNTDDMQSILEIFSIIGTEVTLVNLLHLGSFQSVSTHSDYVTKSA